LEIARFIVELNEQTDLRIAQARIEELEKENATLEKEIEALESDITHLENAE
jgi:cell division protein FtsB